MSSYRFKDIMSADIFKDYTDIEFEGCTFKAFKDHTAYLSNIYGDYMKLPPEDKRVTHHSFEAYYKD